MPASARERPARPPLSHDAVLQAGLGVLRAKGIDGVTMRAVAAELKTGPASLYVYVRNRKDLLDQMFDVVAGTIDLGPEPDPEHWRAQLEALLVRVVAAMDAHPGIARVPLANPPTGLGGLRVADRLLALLQAGGVDDRSAAWFIDVAFLFVTATAYEATIAGEEGEAPADVERRLAEDLGRLDAAAFPHMARLMGPLTAGTREERFLFGVRLLVNGLLVTPPPAA